MTLSIQSRAVTLSVAASVFFNQVQVTRERSVAGPRTESIRKLVDFHPGIALEQGIRDGAGTAFSFGDQIWRGAMAEITAQTIVDGPG